MATISKPIARPKFHHNAYRFVFAALRYTQEQMGRVEERRFGEKRDAEEHHISGQELLEGVRRYALEQYGLLANSVLRAWGIHCTEDVGRLVFELVDRGEMRKTDRDQLSDFYDVYDFEDAFDRDYLIDTSHAFQK